MKKKISILCVSPFNSPHINPVYDEMAAQEDVEVVRASLSPLSSDRLKLGWSEMTPDSPYLQPWRSMRDRLAYYRWLLQADVIVMPGFFHLRTLPFQHWFRRLTNKTTVLWSEPFLNHPRTSHSFLSLTLRKLMLWPCNSSRYNLLATGHGADKDYYALGMTRWNNWLYAFAVQPHEELKRDLTAPPVGGVHIVYSGTVVHRKGIDILIEALGRPDIAGMKWRLTVVGDGDCRAELEGAATRLKIAEKIKFIGAMPLNRCGDIYSTGDVLVLPSRFDGWGAVVNEAMEFGMAVITSDMVGARTPLVKEGVNGLVFRNGDVADLARCLSRLIGDQSLVVKMRLASRDRILMFRPDESARRVVALCRGLVGDAPMPDYQEGLCSALFPAGTGV
ncbi:MAG: glycosyltransferase family 4 protein [Sedimentisphaerales bacterium]|jgi:hypothetical protein